MRKASERAMEDTKTMLSLLGVAMEVNFAGYFASHFGYWTSADTDEEQEGRNDHSTFPMRIGCLEDPQEDEHHVFHNEEDMETCTNDPSTAPTIVTVSRTHPAVRLPEKANSMDGQIECLELLRERARMLEMKAVEYRGLLKLDEATIRDLGSRLTLNVLENEYLNLEIECLLDQKEKVHAQESSAIMQELETARMKIRYLKRKLTSTQLQARKKIAFLEKRIVTMHDEESRNGAQIRKKLQQRLKELEDEAVEIRRKNGILADRNTELSERLESAQKSISTFLENQKESMEEMNQLTEANGELLKKIEQLQADRFADFEELVKLRQLNACLRDELRRTLTEAREELTAKDRRKVSKQNLEPKEEDRHFMFDCADSGAQQKNTSFQEKDAEYGYTSQGSNARYIDTLSSRKSNSSLKTKFFDNLKKLVAKRGNHNNSSSKDSASTPSSFVTSETRSSVSTFSSDEPGRRSSSGSTSSCPTVENSTRGTELDAGDKWKKNSAWIQTSFRPRRIGTRPGQRAILEEDRKVKRCKSDLETLTKMRGTPSGNRSMVNLMQYLD